MSFALTTSQVKARIKTVTRRLGWLNLRPGDRVQAVKKCMGLKKGESIEPLAIIRITDVRREQLRCMTDDLIYGASECENEGFGDHPSLSFPHEFVRFFCSTHKDCTPETVVTRIAFEYEE